MRHDAQNRLARNGVVIAAGGSDDRLAQRIKRAGTDVAVDDADAAERKAPKPGAGTCVRVAINGHLAPERSRYAICHGL
jgi:hypothetical protein